MKDQLEAGVDVLKAKSRDGLAISHLGSEAVVEFVEAEIVEEEFLEWLVGSRVLDSMVVLVAGFAEVE